MKIQVTIPGLSADEVWGLDFDTDTLLDRDCAQRGAEAAYVISHLRHFQDLATAGAKRLAERRPMKSEER